MQNLKIKLVREKAVLPKRMSEGAAGLDLTACIDSPIEIKPNSLHMIPTGIAIALPDNNHAAFIYARSGLAVKHGITLSNCVGVIDSDYRGEIMVGLCNVSEKSYTISSGERIAQMVIAPVVNMNIEQVSELSETERGDGGFGSTGKI